MFSELAEQHKHSVPIPVVSMLPSLIRSLASHPCLIMFDHQFDRFRRSRTSQNFGAHKIYSENESQLPSVPANPNLGGCEQLSIVSRLHLLREQAENALMEMKSSIGSAQLASSKASSKAAEQLSTMCSKAANYLVQLV